MCCPASSPVLAAGLRKKYGSRLVLDGVDFAVADGEVVALLGPNGAGKTTLSGILHGAVRRDGGQLSVLGFDPSRTPLAMRAQIGVVPQETGVHADLTVREVVAHFAAFYPAPLGIDDVIDMVGLGDCAKSLVYRLSGGQQRRLDVATAVVGDPRLIFLDEPTTGLDPEARRQAWEVVRWFQGRGATTLLTTHYLDEAAALADRVIVLVDGKIVAEGSPTDLGGPAAAATIRFALEPRLRDRKFPPLDRSDIVRHHRSGAEIRVSVVTATPTAVLASLTSWAASADVEELPELEVSWPRLEDTYAALLRTHRRQAEDEWLGRVS